MGTLPWLGFATEEYLTNPETGDDYQSLEHFTKIIQV